MIEKDRLPRIKPKSYLERRGVLEPYSTARHKAERKVAKPVKRRKPLRKVGKVGRRRAKGMAKLKPPEDGLCQICGQPPDSRGLAPHHDKKRSHGGDEDPKNIKWACGKCHSGTEGIKEVNSEPQWTKEE